MCHGFNGDHAVGSGLFSLIVSLNRVVVTNREIGGLNKGPGQVSVAVFGIPLAFLFAVAEPCCANAATVGGVVADFGKPLNRASLQHDGQCQDDADPRGGFE